MMLSSKLMRTLPSSGSSTPSVRSAANTAWHVPATAFSSACSCHRWPRASGKRPPSSSPAAARGHVTQGPEVRAKVGGRLRVVEPYELVGQGPPDHAAALPAAAHAEQPQLKRGVRGVRRRGALLAQVLDDIAAGTDDRDIEGAHGDGDFAGRVGGASRVAVRPAGLESALPIALPGEPRHARELGLGRRGERRAVAPEELGLGRASAVVGLAVRERRARAKQLLVVCRDNLRRFVRSSPKNVWAMRRRGLRWVYMLELILLIHIGPLPSQGCGISSRPLSPWVLMGFVLFTRTSGYYSLLKASLSGLDPPVRIYRAVPPRALLKDSFGSERSWGQVRAS